MKKYFSVLILICSLLLSCGKKKDAVSTTSQSDVLKQRVKIQNELVEILERNMNNPDAALKELGLYYKKYASILKAELNSGENSTQRTATEYEAKVSTFEKELILRQKKALNALLKKDTQFYAKMMVLMRKYGLSN